jgi:hypothetical protein
MEKRDLNKSIWADNRLINDSLPYFKDCAFSYGIAPDEPKEETTSDSSHAGTALGC